MHACPMEAVDRLIRSDINRSLPIAASQANARVIMKMHGEARHAAAGIQRQDEDLSESGINKPCALLEHNSGPECYDAGRKPVKSQLVRGA